MATIVRAPPERAYDALTRADELDAWFTTGAEVDARSGGEIVWRWVDFGPDRITAEDRGPVLEATRPHRFVFGWQERVGGTIVEVDFDEHADGTVIRLREHGYPDTPEGWTQLVECATGWGEALTLLKFHVEHDVRY